MKPQRSTSPRIYVLLLLVATGVSIALTPAARGRIDESALKLTGADAALFNLAHDCTYCHGLHGGDPDQLLQNTIVEDLCRSCHDGSFDPDGPGGPLPPAPVATVHTNDPTGNSCCGPFQVTCNECHDPHSNQENHCSGSGPTAACPFGDGSQRVNLKLVLDTVVSPSSGTKRAIIFESRGTDVGDPYLYGFCDKDEDNNDVWDQVCDVCHEGAVRRHHFDGSANHHQDGATCTKGGCHLHSNALSP
jgi:predicted CXXCH cytochrome family protein